MVLWLRFEYQSIIAVFAGVTSNDVRLGLRLQKNGKGAHQPDLGLDLHLKKTYAVLLDRQGNIVDERPVRNSDLPTYLDEVVPHEIYAVLEATRNWPFLYDLLREHVVRVELAHPKDLKAISATAVKRITLTPECWLNWPA
jgi:hypothetical protein